MDDPFEGVTHFSVSLADLKKAMFDEMQKEDLSDAKPLHDAFEVEDMVYRSNFVFVKRESTVDLFDSSRGVGKKLMETFGGDFGLEFPFGTKNAEEYYLHMFHKALRSEDNICFIGYVKETLSSFQPIESEE